MKHWPISIRRWRQSYGVGSNKGEAPSAAYLVEAFYRIPNVHFRTGRCWNPSNRGVRDWMMRRHESGGLEITFGGPQHNSKDIVKVIDPDAVPSFILSCLECMRPEDFNEEEDG
jgi:hypothetical protein